MDNIAHPSISVNATDFADIIRNHGYYVDKTYFISKLLRHSCWGNTLIFTRPRRFGKTMALSMLRDFFDCNHKEENRQLFEGLAVSRDEKCMAEQGKYPVLYMDFTDVTAETYDKAVDQLDKIFHEAIQQFSYILESEKVNPYMLELVRRVFTADDSRLSLGMDLSEICSALVQHHGQDVVVIIDAYDVPIKTACRYGYYDKMDSLMQHLLTIFKDNRDLRLAVLAGVLRVGLATGITGPDHVLVDMVFDQHYSDCFGFTSEEVERMVTDLGYLDKMAEIREWYDGYRFGEQSIYNPWSILNYFDKGCELNNYWVDADNNDIALDALRRLDKVRLNESEELYNGEYTAGRIHPFVSYNRLNSTDSRDIFGLLLATGYLKPVEHFLFEEYRVEIPNNEIRTVFAKRLQEKREQETGHINLPGFTDPFYDDNTRKLEPLLMGVVLQSNLFFGTNDKHCGIVALYLLQQLENKYEILTGREDDLSNSIIFLRPRNYGNTCKGAAQCGIVIEFKLSNIPESPAEHEKIAESTLQQFEEKHYPDAFPPDVHEIRCYCVAFGKKGCAIRKKTIMRKD